MGEDENDRSLMLHGRNREKPEMTEQIRTREGAKAMQALTQGCRELILTERRNGYYMGINCVNMVQWLNSF